ncbi:MAG: chaperone NapD [Gammaproteobacteria bacterium]|nr:chaperone NapD [Gammaproteobacteria bacterium]MCP4996831.1 chaperone NapD [Gammaproteobacteria bacterium]
MNLCSVIVHAKPQNAAVVQTELENFDGVEVHAGEAEGKLVVTVEGSTDDHLADTMAQFNDIKGVINSVMIYHYCGDEPANQEV